MIRALIFAGVFASFGVAALAQDDSISDKFADFAGQIDALKVDIYVENIRAIQDGEGTAAEKQEQINANLNYTAMCALERYFLYGLTDSYSMLEDASRLQSHYGHLAKAMERLSLLNAEQAEKDYWAQKELGEAQVKEIYLKGSDKSDPEAEAKMVQFAQSCNSAAASARAIDDMALERKRNGN